MLYHHNIRVRTPPSFRYSRLLSFPSVSVAIVGMSSDLKLPVTSLPATDDVEKTAIEGEAQVIEDVQREEGTYHQSQLGKKPARKHFFSPLDPSYSEAVHRDAETVRFTLEEEVCSHYPYSPTPTSLMNISMKSASSSSEDRYSCFKYSGHKVCPIHHRFRGYGTDSRPALSVSSIAKPIRFSI